jgi:hypothetical protein
MMMRMTMKPNRNMQAEGPRRQRAMSIARDPIVYAKRVLAQRRTAA